jgi:hypothetical protein
MYRKYKVNENYFEDINSHEKAYILGFIYADGYNGEDTLELAQNMEREDVLIHIKKALETDQEIKYYVPNKGTLNIYSKKICSDLANLGAIRNKSLVLQFPTFLPEDLMCSFILGYFDGDGCVWDGKRKKMTVKDDRHPGQTRERIVHNVKFTFTGNYDFINALQDYLISKNIVNKKTKLNFSKAKNTTNNTTDKVCTMEYSGRKQMAKLYEFMYSKSPIYCQEKKLKFDKIFCALDEKSSIETVLTEETAEMPIVNQASQEEGSSTIPEMGVESSDSKYTAPNE